MPGFYAIYISGEKPVRVADLETRYSAIAPGAARARINQGEELFEIIEHECTDPNHLLEYMVLAGMRLAEKNKLQSAPAPKSS